MARICTKSVIPVQQQGLPFPLATGREAQEHMEHPEGSVVFQYACNMFVSKRVGSRYRSGRSPDWLKFKNPRRPP